MPVTLRQSTTHHANARTRRALSGGGLALLLSLACVVAATPAAIAADGDGVETAALSAGGLRPYDEIPLPLPLKDADAARYRRIFKLQEQDRWAEADREIAKLADRILVGEVLAQRYLESNNYQAKYAELSKWLASYADHADAARVYKLAMKRKPKGAAHPRYPEGTTYNADDDEFGDGDSARPVSASDRRRLARMRSEIRHDIDEGSYGAARQLLANPEVLRLFDPVEYGQLDAEVADGFDTLNQDRDGLAGGPPVRSKRGPAAEEWDSGLNAWHLKKYDVAARHFERLAMIDSIDSWTRAAGAYWAARSNLRAGVPEKVSHWLEIGGNFPYTFYGILSRKLSGKPFDYNWDLPAFTRADATQINATGVGRRALALVQIGQDHRAERELRRINSAQPEMAHALLAVSQRTDMPSLAVQLAKQVTDKSGRRYDLALYPVPAWAPPGGYRVDRAFVFALIRQESNFSTEAKSRRGARGLMQLMPSTARFISSGTGYGGASRQLTDPALNIALGQNYLAHLMGTDFIGDNLFWIVAAYNGGPGNLARWQREIDPADDPLIFLESIPNRETREFVERVMANYWIYRDQLGQAAPELDAIAEGKWPTYKSTDDNLTPAVTKNGGN